MPTRERGRLARMHSRHVPLSFPAMGHPTTLPAGTAWARPKQSPGAVAGRPGRRSWPRLCQNVCGRDARAPGWAFIPRRRRTKGGPSIFVSIRVHSWFVFKNNRQFLPRMICRQGRGGTCFTQLSFSVREKSRYLYRFGKFRWHPRRIASQTLSIPACRPFQQYPFSRLPLGPP